MNLIVRDSTNIDRYIAAHEIGTDAEPLALLRDQWRPVPLGLVLETATPDPTDNDIGILQADGSVLAPVAADFTISAGTPQVFAIPFLSAWYRRFLIRATLTSADVIELAVPLIDYGAGIESAINDPVPMLNISGVSGGWSVSLTSEFAGVGCQIGTLNSISGDIYQLPIDQDFILLRLNSASDITVSLSVSRW